MPNRKKLLKILIGIGAKGVLCIICLAAVGFSLVTYTSTATISPVVQLTTGQTTASWNIYVNEVGQVRYMPGGFTEPTLNTGDTSTYAFEVVTDAYRVCAVQIELTQQVDDTMFSEFEITVLSSTGGAWSSQPLYAASTGSTTISYIDGLQGASDSTIGYIHQAVSTTEYYIIQVTYSYDLVDQNTQIPVTFQFTPLPQVGF